MAETVTGAPPRKKKLPFKQTAIRRPSAAPPSAEPNEGADEDDDGGLSLFKRSTAMAPKIKEEQERRLKRKQQKLEEQKVLDALEDQKRRKQEEETDRIVELAFQSPPPVVSPFRSTDGGTAGHDAGSKFHTAVTPSPRAKRTRLTPGSSSPKTVPDALAASDNEDNARRTSNPQQVSSTTSTHLTKSTSSRSTPKRHRSSANTVPAGTPIVSLDPDSDLDTAPSQPTHKSQRVIPDASKSDEEFAGFHDEDDTDSIWEKRAAEKRAQQQQQAAQNETATVEILVTSSIPNCHQFMFKILFHRPLKQVRDTWCDLQEKKKGVKLPVPKEDVILTWRRQKIWSTDTLLVLGIQPQSHGRGFTTSDRSSEGIARDTAIHMETWTPDSFREMQEKEAQKQRHQAGEYSSDPELEAEPEAQVKKLRIILKAKDLPQVRLSVREETTVETAIGGFKKESGVGPGQTVRLWFDGEQLEEHITMEEAGIEDKDTLDVHIR